MNKVIKVVSVCMLLFATIACSKEKSALDMYDDLSAKETYDKAIDYFNENVTYYRGEHKKVNGNVANTVYMNSEHLKTKDGVMYWENFEFVTLHGETVDLYNIDDANGTLYYSFVDYDENDTSIYVFENAETNSSDVLIKKLNARNSDAHRPENMKYTKKEVDGKIEVTVKYDAYHTEYEQSANYAPEKAYEKFVIGKDGFIESSITKCNVNPYMVFNSRNKYLDINKKKDIQIDEKIDQLQAQNGKVLAEIAD